MLRLEINNLKAYGHNIVFMRVLHHLRLLGCNARVRSQNDFYVADLSLEDAMHVLIEAEVERSLSDLARCIAEPTRVALCNDDGEYEFYIGPGARELNRTCYLTRAADYATRAGKMDLAALLGTWEGR